MAHGIFDLCRGGFLSGLLMRCQPPRSSFAVDVRVSPAAPPLCSAERWTDGGGGGGGRDRWRRRWRRWRWSGTTGRMKGSKKRSSKERFVGVFMHRKTHRQQPGGRQADTNLDAEKKQSAPPPPPEMCHVREKKNGRAGGVGVARPALTGETKRCHPGGSCHR